MNDERSMILKMLQEGKISVEEADALLDVLNEPEVDAGGGFSKADAGGHGTDATPGPAPASKRADDRGRDDDHGAHPGGEQRGEHRGEGAGAQGFRFDFDLSGLQDTLRTTMGSVRETMQGVSASLRDAFSGLGDLENLGDLARTMGKVRASDARELAADTGETGTLRVSNKWGDVRVTGVDAARVSVTARVTCWAADEEAARAAVAATAVRLDEEAGEWVLSSDLGSEQATRIDYELEVPRGLGVSVTTASGDLWLEDLAGSQTVNTMSGDVTVASLGSTASDAQSVSTKSGDVIAASLTGEVTLNSLSGDVSVNGFTGFLRASTQSGDIEVSGGRGSVQLRAMSGDISAELLEVGEEPVRLTSVSGDALLVVPTDASLDVSAASTSGDADVHLDLEGAERGEHRVRGTYNGGRVRTELSSVSGDVQISAS
ncbi:MAG: DUF4097 family beta strand repeat-containing protein [Spirochaetota bacterium]